MSSLEIMAIVSLSLFGVVGLWGIFFVPLFRRAANRKQEEKMTKIIAGFKEGDKILLASGIRAYFVKRKRDVLYVEIAENVIIKIDKHAVMGVYE